MNNAAVSWMPYTTVFAFSMILVALIIEVIVISRMFWSPDDVPVGIRQAIRYSEMLENAMVALMVGLGGGNYCFLGSSLCIRIFPLAHVWTCAACSGHLPVLSSAVTVHLCHLKTN